MFIFPIGTDCAQRRFPWMNVLLIAANILIFLFSYPFNHLPGQPGISPYSGLWQWCDPYLLSPQNLHLSQFITYQFLHAGLSHIFFNMLFLYGFGNNLNEKLGHVGYLAFYLTGGILAGCGQVMASTAPTLGASGAISAVTGLFLVLLPRTHIRMFVSIFFLYIDVWEIPSMFFVLFKLGEDVVERFLGGSDVAYMAHISGTVAGIVIGLVLLLARLVQRDHYDLLAMLNRYRRRKAYEAVVATGYNPFLPSASAPAVAGVAGLFNRGEIDGPTRAPGRSSYRESAHRDRPAHSPARTSRCRAALPPSSCVRHIDPTQFLPEQEQLDIANQLMADGRYPEAAAAYEDYLRVYPGASQRDPSTLILGLIYARYFPKPDRARALFSQILPRLHNAEQKAMAEAELQALGGPPPNPPPAQAG